MIDYNPRDLTISVGAGISYCELTGVLSEHRQMIPLDPPFSESATMGGIIAANTSGPRRRLYGSARDMVIGMTFATLEGKLIRTGGMVVKNVAGSRHGQAHDRIVWDAGRDHEPEFPAAPDARGSTNFRPGL